MFSRKIRSPVILLLALLTLGAGLAWKHWSVPNHSIIGEIETVEWEETKPRVTAGEWVLVDARSEKRFANGHLPKAYSLPADAPSEYLRFAVEEWPPDSVVVAYCGSPSCSLAAELATRLREEAGLEGVRVLTGNYFKDLYQTGRDAGTRSAQDREEESAH
ncbi:MAG: rhodanese-like domain-containing protein [Chthoniobacterales bacterium]|nr:rhodanese-like domain-containing protein [Chthoniobacterales bacterium]